MANFVKDLPSGATLEIQMGSFEDCFSLMKVVMREIESIDIQLGVKGKDFMSGNLGEEALNTLKNIVARLISSEAVSQSLKPLLGRVLYNNMKISSALMESEDFRGDYLLIVKECMVYNLTPFFKNLNSLLSGFPAIASKSQA